MRRNKPIFKLLRWWVVSNLPEVHIFNGQEGRGPLLNFLSLFLIHPIKRRIAKYFLIILRATSNIKVIGISGSAGKTTTKEMLYSILKKQGATVASFANIDPVYNIPNTILRCKPNTRYLILEMGVEYPEEMDFYLWLAKPDIGVITNIYKTHLLFFKSIDGVFREKFKLIKSLKKQDYAILNKENIYCKKMINKTKANVMTFGDKGEVKAGNIRIDSNLKTNFTLSIQKSKYNVRIPITGRQFVENALTATAAAKVLGVSEKNIVKGLEKFSNQKHRMSIKILKNNSMVMDDSYNNNPSAAKAALKTYSEVLKKGNWKKSVIVFGDMLELGEDEIPAHREIGRLIATLKPDYLIVTGNAARIVGSVAAKTLGQKNIFWNNEKSEVVNMLKKEIRNKTLILIKGSRSLGLDSVVSQLS